MVDYHYRKLVSVHTQHTALLQCVMSMSGSGEQLRALLAAGTGGRRRRDVAGELLPLDKGLNEGQRRWCSVQSVVRVCFA